MQSPPYPGMGTFELRRCIARTVYRVQRHHFARIALAGLCLTMTSTALAEKPSESIQLRYTSPSECPSREALLRAIDPLVDAGTELDHSLDVTAYIDAQGPTAYLLNLRWNSDAGGGQRSIDAESCQAAADAAAWLISLAIKRPGRSEATTKQPESSTNPLRYEIGIDAAAGLGTLPGVAWSAGLRAGILWFGLSADLSVAYFPATRVERSRASIDVALAEVGLQACYLVSGTRFAAGPCGRAALGQMTASSRGLRAPSDGAARFQVFALGVQARARLADSFSLTGLVDLGWHQRRPVFVISGAGEVFQSQSVGLRVGLGFLLML